MLANLSLIDPGRTGAFADAGARESGGQQSVATFAGELASHAAMAAGKLRTAEASAAAGLGGEASTQAVVHALLEAERTLQAAVTIREKVLAAIQDVARMQL